MNAFCETQETYTLVKGNIFHLSPQSPLQTLINLNPFHTPAEKPNTNGMSHSGSLCVSLGPLSIAASQIPLCIKISVKIPGNPMCRIITAHLFFAESHHPHRCCREMSEDNRALSEKTPESWLWELGDWKRLGLGMVLSTLEKTKWCLCTLHSSDF